MEKINIAKLLKDCPQGMELDCTMYDDVAFNRLQGNEYIIINRGYNGGEVHLTKFGQMFNSNDAKCVIFPKGKTTWEGFHRPFRDGDIVAYDGADGETQLYICKDQSEINHCCLCYLRLDCDGELDLDKGWYYITRFATEEEKAKLFKAIKDNGYKWNVETKTLEKLVEPKFKVGDRIKNKLTNDYYSVIDIKCREYYIRSILTNKDYQIPFESEINYELLPNKFDINTLKPFDKVLARDCNEDKWNIDFFSYYRDNGTYQCMTFTKNQCIPYESNQHLLNTTNDCDDFYKTWEK